MMTPVSLREWCNQEYLDRTEEGRMEGWRGQTWDWVKENFPKDEIKSILDIGTGQGVILNLVSVLTGARDCFGIDVSDIQIERCEERWLTDRLHFRRVDFLELELKRKFDLVICWSTLLHIPPEDVGDFAARMVDAAGKYILLVHARPDRPNVPERMEWYHDEHELFGDLEAIASHDTEPGGACLKLRIYKAPSVEEEKKVEEEEDSREKEAKT
jgi:SAM-dependent methyltransferase